MSGSQPSDQTWAEGRIDGLTDEEGVGVTDVRKYANSPDPSPKRPVSSSNDPISGQIASLSPRVRVRFAWYDLWVGAYIDRAKRVLYICPLPTLLVEVRLGR